MHILARQQWVWLTLPSLNFGLRIYACHLNLLELHRNHRTSKRKGLLANMPKALGPAALRRPSRVRTSISIALALTASSTNAFENLWRPKKASVSRCVWQLAQPWTFQRLNTDSHTRWCLFP